MKHMKKKNALAILFIGAMLATALPQTVLLPVASAATQPFYYAVWLPFWQSKSGAGDISIHLNSLHEVSPFSYEVGANGALIDDLRIGNGSWDPWFSAVRDNGTKIIPTIAWLNGDAIYNLLSDGPERRALENMVAALVKSKKFDGIDIDFEGMPSSTKPYFSTFIYGLALRLHPSGKMLSCTVVPRTPVSSLYDSNPLPTVGYAENYITLNKYCDEVRVMAYDQGTIDIKLDASKGNGALYAPTADPAWVEKVIKETLQYINPRKVMLGIPTYGYEYQVSWNMGATTYERVRSFGFFDAMDRAVSLGIEPYRNNAGELSFAYASTTHVSDIPIVLTSIVASTQPAALATVDPNATTTFFVSFSDVSSTADKIALAKKYGLRGAVLFKADGQMDPAIWGIMH
jgi:spore germination protein YaaH